MISQSDSGSEHAVTRSGVSAGAINITNQAGQAQEVANLNRDTSSLNGTVSKTPDVQNLLNQQADTMNAAQAAGQVVAQGIGAYADTKQKDAQQAADAAKLAGDTAAQAAYQAEADSWDEGGSNRLYLHIAGGALIGGLGGGGIGSAAQGAAGADWRPCCPPRRRRLLERWPRRRIRHSQERCRATCLSARWVGWSVELPARPRLRMRTCITSGITRIPTR